MFAAMVLSDLFGERARVRRQQPHVMKSQPEGVILKVGVITIKRHN